MPDCPSAQAKLTVTSALFQPSPFATGFRLPVIVGAVASRTVTVNPALAVFPFVSCAEQRTDVVPNAKPEPDAGRQATGRAPSRLSVAVGLVQETGVSAPVQSTVRLPGTPESTGATVS
jgi:hypothetical protein